MLVGLPASCPRSPQNVDMVGEAVEESSGEPLRAKHLGPLVEGQVGGNQDRSSLVALAEHLEEQIEFRTSRRNVGCHRERAHH